MQKLKHILMKALAPFIYLFAWEMFEELIEEGIAFGITTLIAKTISIVFVVTFTQGLKVAIKRLIKTLTYKEGNDKMKLLKNYFTIMWGNKITGTMSGILGAGLVYFQATLPQYAGIIWIAAIAFVVCYNIAAFTGGEYFYQILDRIAKANLKKEEYAKIKAAEAKAKQIALAKDLIAKVEEAKKLIAQENELQPKLE